MLEAAVWLHKYVKAANLFNKISNVSISSRPTASNASNV